MQRFQIQLSKTVEERTFLDEWMVQNHEINSGPKAEFTFQGSMLSVVIHTFSTTSWPAESFKRALQPVLHKVDPECHITGFTLVS
jgi:hypothetical protein